MGLEESPAPRVSPVPSLAVLHGPDLADGSLNATVTKICLLPRLPLPPRVWGFLFALHSHRSLLGCSLAPSLPVSGEANRNWGESWSSLLHELFYDSCAVGGAGLWEGRRETSLCFFRLLKRNSPRNPLSQADASSMQGTGPFAKMTKPENSRTILKMVTGTAL